MSEPDGQLGSVEQEARTCPVCGTKFFATADRQILSSLYPAQSFRRGTCTGRGTRSRTWLCRQR